MTTKTLLTTLTLAWAGVALAQTPQWDCDKYPDYDPTPRFDMTAHRHMTKRMASNRAAGQTRPDHWNNGLMEAFPPVVNQSGGSCGSASRIYYMFAEEINAARGANGKLDENIYPTHFTWLLTWCPDQGKEVIAQHNGIPNSAVYGGYTFSDLFGYQDCDSQTGYDFGWMQGYDKWHHAMHNRITGSANFAIALDKEEGREMVKNYLWNHCGDNSFSTGGVVGVGVASGGDWKKIPKTATNDQLGVTGKYYVKHWGNSVDHALTIVGYDDRIEFDLDGNGVKGEADKDEVGAWIVVNSWGASWCNGGFIYCPYAEARPTSTTTGYWTPEYYTIRRDYRPLRTLKVKMDYSARSEIAIYVGYSTKLTSTKPEKETWLRHFKYSGLSKGFTASAANPDPAIPMLGRWADGELHTEPMEFGYDLTDLVADVDPATPLKYFLRIDTRSWAKGEGHIYNASIIDYSIDPEGIETPFEIEEGGKVIANKGKKTTITAIARAEALPAPRNLTIDGQQLAWQAPAGAQYAVSNYRVYCDNSLVSTLDGGTTSTTAAEPGNYAVTAIYDINGNDCESAKSGIATRHNGDPATAANIGLHLSDGAQITVPHYNEGSTNAFTIEFWLKPSALSATADNFGIKASSGKFFFKVNKTRKVEVGFDGGDCNTSSRTLKADTWQHVAITANAGNLNVYVDGTTFLQCASGWSNTVGSVGNLTLGQTEGTTTSYKETYPAPWNGAIDELRIWNEARTAAQVKKAMKETFYYPALEKTLAYYYKMDTREEGTTKFLVDAVSGNDATITNPASATTAVIDDLAFSAAAATDFSLPTSVSVGKAVTMTSLCAPGTLEWAWTFTGADIASSASPQPVVVFNEAGTQTVKLATKNVNGETTEKQRTITVNAVEAPQADFTVSTPEVAVGDHVSFINTSTPIDDCTYEWTLTGADNENMRTVNAAATYLAAGTYTVRLTATNAAGSSSVEKQIEVVRVAPQAAFTIHNNVAIVGEDIELIDNTTYEPSEWLWTVASPQSTYVVNGQNSTLKIEEPGMYSVSLKATNDKGSNTTTRTRAIYVCSADGETGLKFDDSDDEVVAKAPFGDNRVSAFTIDFWLYPGTLSESCLGIGDDESTFFMHGNLDGSLTVTINGKSATSMAGLLTTNEWHHYAMTYSSGTIEFFRDGTPYTSTVKITGVTSTPAWSCLRLGGSKAPMNAIIDELRVWKRRLTTNLMQQYANNPVSEPTANTDLVLYYNFNQSSGDVEDQSASNNPGRRSNFGPDGDAWTSSRGIFYLNFDEEKDITKEYLKNYKAPFKTASGYVNGTSRFKRLQTGTDASPWQQENSITAGGVTTEFHVDGNKNNYLTLSTTWDGFAEQVQSLKLYQPVSLPAGSYVFYAMTDRMTEWVPAQTKTVVSTGNSLPDWDEIDTQALTSSPCGLACKFMLTEPTTVNLGLVSNQKGQACHTISQFYLVSKTFHYQDANGGNAIHDIAPEVSATSRLQAFGGLGAMRIVVAEPQFVSIHTISGQLVWSSFVEHEASLRLPAGLYVTDNQKVIVR